MLRNLPNMSNYTLCKLMKRPNCKFNTNLDEEVAAIARTHNCIEKQQRSQAFWFALILYM